MAEADCDRRDVIKGIPFFVGIFVRWRSDSSCIGLLGEGGLIGGKGMGRLGGRSPR